MLNSRLNTQNGCVLAYRRAAAVQERFGSSLEEQLAAIHQYCDANGLPRPWSEYAYIDLPGLGELHSIILRNLVASLDPGDIVIAASADRLSRDPVVLARTVRAIQQRGAVLIVVADDFDSRRPSAELMLALLDGGERAFVRVLERSDGEASHE
jgi:DNA invertase Pin-like site-specific DNA recombinase